MSSSSNFYHWNLQLSVSMCPCNIYSVEVWSRMEILTNNWICLKNLFLSWRSLCGAVHWNGCWQEITLGLYLLLTIDWHFSEVLLDNMCEWHTKRIGILLGEKFSDEFLMLKDTTDTLPLMSYWNKQLTHSHLKNPGELPIHLELQFS